MRGQKEEETVYLPLMVIGRVISNADAESNGNEEEGKCRRTARDEIPKTAGMI